MDKGLIAARNASWPADLAFAMPSTAEIAESGQQVSIEEYEREMAQQPMVWPPEDTEEREALERWLEEEHKKMEV